MFKENKVPLFSQNITKVELTELGNNNDNNTDNEQIKNGVNIIKNNILKELGKYKRNIQNIVKYRK